jgi:hypothetical protein
VKKMSKELESLQSRLANEGEQDVQAAAA